MYLSTLLHVVPIKSRISSSKIYPKALKTTPIGITSLMCGKEKTKVRSSTPIIALTNAECPVSSDMLLISEIMPYFSPDFCEKTLGTL